VARGLATACLMATTTSAMSAPLVSSLDHDGAAYGNDRLRHDEEVIATALVGDDQVWTATTEQITLWSISDGAVLQHLEPPCSDGYVSGMAVAPSGQRLVIGCTWEEAKIVDRRGRVEEVLPLTRLSHIRWHGEVIAGQIELDDEFASEQLQLWSVPDRKVTARLLVGYDAHAEAHGDTWVVSGVLDRPDQSTGHVRAMSADGGQLWRIEFDGSYGLDISSTGHTLALTTCTDVVLVDLATGTTGPRMELDGCVDRVAAVGDQWWVSDGDQIVRTDARLQPVGPALPHKVQGLAASPDGRWVMDGNGTRPRLFRADGEPLPGQIGLSAPATVTAASGDLVAATNNNEAVLIVRSTGAHHPVLMPSVDVVDVAPDGSVAAFAGEGVTLMTADGIPIPVLGVSELWGIDTIGFSADAGVLWVVSSSSDAVRLTEIDVAAARMVSTRTLTDQWAVDASISADRRHVVIPGVDGRLLVYPLR